MYHFVEEKLKKAADRGEFDNLPGIGKPLDFHDDLPGLPSELKMSYRILKNAGYLSEDETSKPSDLTIHDLLSCATDGIEKGTFEKKLQFEELATKRKWDKNSRFAQYANKIYEKLFK